MKKIARFIAATLVLVGASLTAQAETQYEERVMGDPNAPVTLIEYASYTCSHCADFHKNVLPQIKKDYVETGKVKVIFRDFPFERVGATAALLSRCVDEKRYVGFNDLLMKQQEQWAGSKNPIGSLFTLAKLAGMSQEKIDSCLANEKLLDKIIMIRKEAMDTHGFNSTPSFLINGEKVVGGGEYSRFKDIIEGKLK
ncbi:DsbA family protein [Terasakiella sp. SH-1]|uniref:DsbA family protein n=1 Tax=Terasakiella sp. SH-1 TaxID=2560057 RepID=UPI001431829E|nr:DsbA family protein [Terasakiella sp. SH-1]